MLQSKETFYLNQDSNQEVRTSTPSIGLLRHINLSTIYVDFISKKFKSGKRIFMLRLQQSCERRIIEISIGFRGINF